MGFRGLNPPFGFCIVLENMELETSGLLGDLPLNGIIFLTVILHTVLSSYHYFC